jgi:cytochrome c553
MFSRTRIIITIVSLFLLIGTTSLCAAEDVQKQIDEIKGALPKFAIPMREVGDRFQNMYFAAQGGNWGLAAYMSKYMNNSMNPAKVTKPKEYEDWKSFYEITFAPVNKTIMAQDIKTFNKEYNAVITSCNACHEAMGYGFIKVIKMKKPADEGIGYLLKSKATDVPK